MLNKYLGVEADKFFDMRCKIKTAHSSFKNARDQQNENDLVFLLPAEGTQKDLFYSRYLPKISEARPWIEFLAEMAYPVCRTARMAICKSSEFYPHGPYIHVMDNEAIELLKKIPGKTVSIRTLSENEEARLFSGNA